MMPVVQLLVYRRELPKLRARASLQRIEELLAANPYVNADFKYDVIERLQFDAAYPEVKPASKTPAELTQLGFGVEFVPRAAPGLGLSLEPGPLVPQGQNQVSPAESESAHEGLTERHA